MSAVARVPSNRTFVGHYRPMAPSEDDVRRQLDRLLASAPFANAGRMSRFLKFVVERTLAGDAERLKEYVIGVEVFDRDTDYDPRVDSIVRVEAARLRSKLAEYYAGEGRSDAVVLGLPKGGYAAVIKLESRPAAPNGAAALGAPALRAEPPPQPLPVSARPLWALGTVLAVAAAAAVVAWVPNMAPAPALRIAVLPFTPDATDGNSAALVERLTEGVTAELVRDGRFGVVASSAARAEYSRERRPRDIGAALDADILVEARVTTGTDRVRVEARVMDGRREEKLWVRGFAGTVATTEELEREIAGAVADAVGALQPRNQ